MNLYGYEFQRESHFSHHGVVGMRWGVRKDTDKIYSKANNKFYKFKNKALKYDSIANALLEKAWKDATKKGQYSKTNGRKLNCAYKMRDKADDYANKAMKLRQKMIKKFKDVPISFFPKGTALDLDKINDSILSRPITTQKKHVKVLYF